MWDFLKSIWNALNLKQNIISKLLLALKLGLIGAIIIYVLYKSNAFSMVDALINNYPNK